MIKKVKNIGMYAFLILVTFISVFPLYWMVSASTNKSVDVSKGVLSLGSHLGENLKNLLANQDVGAALVNSFKYAILLTIVSMVICSLAGYGFEIYHDKAKDAVMGVILLAMMVPFITILVPLFQMVAKMKMLNSTLGFILPTVSTPFLIMMFRQSARSFPRDIIEAARLDGLSEIRIFFQMFIPTMKSTYAAAMTITFMNAWNSYMWPKVIMTQSKSMTMPMVVANLTEGYVTETDGDTSVVLDTNLTPELIEEGFVREIISKIQTMRKEAGFEVMDKIHVYAKDNQRIMDIMENHRDEIMSEVLAEEITLNEADGYVKEWNINKENVVLGVTRK